MHNPQPRRYRIQGNSLQALSLAAQELARRLTAHFAPGKRPQQQQPQQPGAAGPGCLPRAAPDGDAAAASSCGDGAGDSAAGTDAQPPNEASSSAAPSPAAFCISLQEELPLPGWFELVDEHFGARLAVAGVRAQLEQRAAQLRAVQKRLLARLKVLSRGNSLGCLGGGQWAGTACAGLQIASLFHGHQRHALCVLPLSCVQDATPAPLGQLELLLEETYEQLVALGEELEEAQAAQTAAAHNLAAGTQLLLLLIR